MTETEQPNASTHGIDRIFWPFSLVSQLQWGKEFRFMEAQLARDPVPHRPMRVAGTVSALVKIAPPDRACLARYRSDVAFEQFVGDEILQEPGRGVGDFRIHDPGHRVVDFQKIETGIVEFNRVIADRSGLGIEVDQGSSTTSDLEVEVAMSGNWFNEEFGTTVCTHVPVTIRVYASHITIFDPEQDMDTRIVIEKLDAGDWMVVTAVVVKVGDFERWRIAP